VSEQCPHCGHLYGERCVACHRMFACGDQTSVLCPVEGCSERIEPTLLEQVEILERLAPSDEDRALLGPLKELAQRIDVREGHLS
jgi:hypothetical protein